MCNERKPIAVDESKADDAISDFIANYQDINLTAELYSRYCAKPDEIILIRDEEGETSNAYFNGKIVYAFQGGEEGVEYVDFDDAEETIRNRLDYEHCADDMAAMYSAVDESDVVIVKDGEGNSEPHYKGRLVRLRDKTEESLRSAYVHAAIDAHGSKKIAINDDAKVSLVASGSGAWVAAWAWVSQEKLQEEGK